MKLRRSTSLWFSLAVLLLGGAPSVQTADAADRPAQLVRLSDGRRMNFRCSGQGQPTVLFDGGFAATSTAWYKVQPLIARDHRACAYDRGAMASTQAPCRATAPPWSRTWTRACAKPGFTDRSW
jgi:hypothetical protein